MKDTVITIRVSSELKEKLEEKSFQEKKSNSKIIREILEKEFRDPVYISLGNERYYNEETDRDLIVSHRFTSLIFFIYDKVLDPEVMETNAFYENLINVIDEINQSKIFGNEVINEFNKVKSELIDCLNSNTKNYFDFVKEEDGLNYETIRTAFHIIMYDSNNEKVIDFN